MTVGELRKRLEGMPDDMRVLTPAGEHALHEISACNEEHVARRMRPVRRYTEYYGPQYMEAGEVLDTAMVLR